MSKRRITAPAAWMPALAAASLLIACSSAPAHARDECGYVHGFAAGTRAADDQRTAAAALVELDGRRFDPVSGADTRNYPPDPQVQFDHIRLDLDFADLMTRTFTAVETIEFTTLLEPLEELDLDGVDLKLERVSDAADNPVPYRYDDRKLTAQFEPALPPKTKATLKIRYECREPKDGMIFALPDAGYPDRPLMIHTQGEAETNRYWFFSHDYPNVRCSTEIAVTIPEKYKALSNGKLVEQKSLGGGRALYHYALEQPHVSYLVSLVIGDFAVVRDEWRGRPVEYWVPPKEEALARRTCGRTPEMMELFSKLTSFDYPYAKYSQAACYLFSAGGMENTSATTMHENLILDERALLDQDQEGLIAHELAHQWFGDTVTCRTWAHLWLNEGFATYMASVWAEHSKGQDEYLWSLWNTMRGVAEADRVDLRGGLVFPYYDDAEDTFRRGSSNPYGKGSSVLHMLRRTLGDDLFWRCIGAYVQRNAWKCAESDDLRRVCEELSGQSLDRFFQQWVYRSGVPNVRVGYEWNESEHELRLTLEQTQTITETAPAFAADVDVWLVLEDDKSGADGANPAGGGAAAGAPGSAPAARIEKRVAQLEQRVSKLIVKCAHEPSQVCFDPNLALLAKVELNLPTSMLLRTLRGGPTLPARLYALRALANTDRRDVREALRAIMLDAREHKGIRSEAAGVLGQMQQEQARDILLAALETPETIADHDVRRAAVSALGQYRTPQVVEMLLRYARHDVTYAVESAASSALGGQEPTEEVVAVLLENTRKTSHGDQIRSAAVGALARLDETRGIEPAMALAAYGQPFRSRGSGISALGRLGQRKERREAVRKFLLGLIHDPQDRAARSAIGALGTLGDEDAVPELRKFADGSADRNLRQAARDAVEAILKKQDETAAIRDLRARIEALEKARERLERKLAKPEGERN